MKAGHFSPDTLEFLRLLHAHQAKVLLVGGEAVIYHGHARLTGVVDLFFEATRENAARLFAALLEFWGGRVPVVSGPEDLLTPGAIVQFGRPPNRIDLLSSISGVSFEEAWAGRVVETIGDAHPPIPVCVIGRRELVKNKQAARRAKDLDDLEFLTHSRREGG